MKIAFLFSGQGAQYVGMGKELHDNFQICRKVFTDANESLSFSISDICFLENEKINQTEFTQPAILTVSIAIFSLLTEKGVRPDYLAGLSLGEYSALVASGAFDFKQAVKLVKNRGRYMTEAVSSDDSAMTAILGLDVSSIEQVCNEASCENYKVMIANYNAPGQTVIAGHRQAVEKAERLAIDKGAKKVIRLNVSGPFHTYLLEPASKKLNLDLNNININKMNIPVITNLTADISSDEDLINTLTKQIMSPVKWEQTVNKLISMGVDTFVELGPSKILTSFVKKIDRSLNTYNVEDLNSLEKTCRGLNIC